MAHGPVNKAWFVKIASNVTFKVNESVYEDVKNEHPNAPISVLIGSRTDRCVHLWDGAIDELTANGYEHKNGNIYGKMTMEYEFTA